MHSKCYTCDSRCALIRIRIRIRKATVKKGTTVGRCGTVGVGAVLAGLESVRKSGDGWIARCPAHEDRYPSLKVSVNRANGNVLLNCKTGCSFTEICSALGLKPQQLFGESRPVEATAPKAEMRERVAGVMHEALVVLASARDWVYGHGVDRDRVLQATRELDRQSRLRDPTFTEDIERFACRTLRAEAIRLAVEAAMIASGKAIDDVLDSVGVSLRKIKACYAVFGYRKADFGYEVIPEPKAFTEDLKRAA